MARAAEVRKVVRERLEADRKRKEDAAVDVLAAAARIDEAESALAEAQASFESACADALTHMTRAQLVAVTGLETIPTARRNRRGSDQAPRPGIDSVGE